jgi:hypothetical protein
MALRRRSPQDNGRVSYSTMIGGDFGKLFPHLLEFLCQSEWEADAPRLTGTVLLCVEDGRLKAWLHDRDAKESLWVSGMDLDDLLATSEQALSSGVGEWRKDKPSFKGNGRRPS